MRATPVAVVSRSRPRASRCTGPNTPSGRSMSMVVVRRTDPGRRGGVVPAGACGPCRGCRAGRTGLLRPEAERSVEADRLAVEVVVLDDRLHQRGVLVRTAHPLGELHGLGEPLGR